MVKAPPWGYQVSFVSQGIALFVSMFDFLFGSRQFMGLLGIITAVILLVCISRAILWRR